MFLDKIVAVKEQEVERLIESFQLAAAEDAIAKLPPCRGFARALTAGRKRPTGLIAEVKKASPSKGLIRSDFEPVSIARIYEQAGADCISVLTDEQFFQGSSLFLEQIRAAVSLPLLRKDFIIDFRQVYEARMIGADAVLLIAAILSPERLRELLALSRDLGMDALVEVHDRKELETVLETDAELIGINNRNLHTFVTDIAVSERLIPLIPPGKTIVSESGISSDKQIELLRTAGADAVLVGEYFMRKQDIASAVQQLMGEVTV